jgi:hypothetical protein
MRRAIASCGVSKVRLLKFVPGDILKASRKVRCGCCLLYGGGGAAVGNQK